MTCCIDLGSYGMLAHVLVFSQCTCQASLVLLTPFHREPTTARHHNRLALGKTCGVLCMRRCDCVVDHDSLWDLSPAGMEMSDISSQLSSCQSPPSLQYCIATQQARHFGARRLF